MCCGTATAGGTVQLLSGTAGVLRRAGTVEATARRARRRQGMAMAGYADGEMMCGSMDIYGSMMGN
jgi:hypothetical protein